MTLRTIGSASSKTNVHSKREPGVECGPGFLKCGPGSWRTKPAVRGKINDKCKGKLRMSGKETAVISMNQQIANKVGLSEMENSQEIEQLGRSTSIDEVAQDIQRSLSEDL
jgi:hypothetical protein